jgi:hypothetical protein
MKRTHELELKVTLDELHEDRALQIARDHFRATGGAQAPSDNSGVTTWKEIPAEEALPDVIDAVMELIRGNALCEQAGSKWSASHALSLLVKRGAQNSHSEVDSC